MTGYWWQHHSVGIIVKQSYSDFSFCIPLSTVKHIKFLLWTYSCYSPQDRFGRFAFSNYGRQRWGPLCLRGEITLLVIGNLYLYFSFILSIALTLGKHLITSCLLLWVLACELICEWDWRKCGSSVKWSIRPSSCHHQRFSAVIAVKSHFNNKPFLQLTFMLPCVGVFQ